MPIPSFSKPWKAEGLATPEIYVLEVRKPDMERSAPSAWLVVERLETVRYDERDNSVFEATIELIFEPLRLEYEGGRSSPTSFTASYHTLGTDGPWISLTSHSYGHGAVFLDPTELRGHRIGTFLMNEIVLWARQWPSAIVNPIELLEGQAYNENRARRNRFYEQFGLSFDYTDGEHREGLSRPVAAGLLTPVDTWKRNLRILQVDEFLGNLLHERQELTYKTKRQQAALSHLTQELKRASDRPVWWAVRQLWDRHRVGLAAAGIVIGFIALSWSGWLI